LTNAKTYYHTWLEKRKDKYQGVNNKFEQNNSDFDIVKVRQFTHHKHNKQSSQGDGDTEYNADDIILSRCFMGDRVVFHFAPIKIVFGYFDVYYS
jgi:hypothetical protein